MVEAAKLALAALWRPYARTAGIKPPDSFEAASRLYEALVRYG